MTPTSYLEINLKQLAANLGGYRDLHNNTPVCAVVKADAYGLGLGPVTQTFIEQQIDMLAVFSPEQAVELLAINPPCPVLILMPTTALPDHSAVVDAVKNGRLHLSIHHQEQLPILSSIAKKHNAIIPVHLYIDTGMSRAGLSAKNLDIVVEQLADHGNLKLAGVYTHFSSAEDDAEFTELQQNMLFELLAKHKGQIGEDIIIHTANSYAALRDNKYTNKMLRLGLGLYGYAPQTMEPESMEVDRIRPVVRWMSQIAHVDEYEAGKTVGYNRTYTLERKSRLGMVPVGYGDGYPTTLSNKGTVRVLLRDGEFVEAAIRGRVNMDQITIDLTELPGDVGVGSEVEVYSNEIGPANALHKLADLAGHNCYEMLCRLSDRIERRYI